MSDHLPELREDQSDSLLEALTTHKVEGRFLDRLSSGCDAVPLWLRGRVEQVYDARLAVVAQRDADVAWMTETVTSHPSWDGQPMIRLKGNSAAVFLEGKRRHRFTQDIDLLTSQPATYLSMLTDIGYRPMGDDTRGPAGWWRFCHEMATLLLDNRIDVDLHTYFPVWRYPQGPYHVAVPASPELRMSDWVTAGRLDYETVRETSIPHPGVTSGHMRIPGLEMTAFVLCLHVFHDFVAPALTQPLAKVRLVELCELRDLCEHADFDAAYFSWLVEKHDAQDAVTLCRRLLDELGAPLGGLAHVDAPERAEYPQEIGFGLLINTRTPLRDLLVRSDTFGAIPETLGAVDVPVTEAGYRVSTRPAHASSTDSRPAVFRSTPVDHPNGNFDFECLIRKDGDHATFEMRADGAAGVFFDEIVLFFGNEIVHSAYDVYQSGFRVPPKESGCTASWQIAEDAWTVTVRIPIGILERHRSADGSVSLILQGGRFLRSLNDSWYDFYRSSVSSSCVRLRVSLGEVPG